MIFQGLISALKIGLFMGCQCRNVARKRGHARQSQRAVLFEWFGLSCTVSLNNIFQLEETDVDCLRDTDAVGASIPGNNACLPQVEEAPYDPTHNHEDERVESGHT